MPGTRYPGSRAAADRDIRLLPRRPDLAPSDCNRPERFHRRADMGREVLRLLLTKPSLEANLEGGHARFGSEARGGLGDAARTERLRDRDREGGQLDELALLDL